MEEQNITSQKESKTWFYTALNILNAFLMLGLYLQVRIVKTLAFWEPIMTFKMWCWIDESEQVKKDFKIIMWVYAHIILVLLIIYTNWILVISFIVIVTAVNLIVRHYAVKSFIAYRDQICTLTGLKDYQIAKIMRITDWDLKEIERAFNVDGIGMLKTILRNNPD